MVRESEFKSEDPGFNPLVENISWSVPYYGCSNLQGISVNTLKLPFLNIITEDLFQHPYLDRDRVYHSQHPKAAKLEHDNC